MKYIHLFIASIVVIITFILSIFVAFIPAGIMRLFKKKEAYQKWMRLNGTNIARIIVWILGMKVEVEGRENLPARGESVCFVANHQSMLDIPLVMACLGVWAGFITKSELKKVPILNVWIEEMQCVYINRKSPRSSIEAILKGVENIKKGVPMFVFPEGTRSKTGALGEFKTGSLKLATRAKATIIPITIEGSRDALETKKGIKRSRVHLTVSKPIETAHLSEDEIHALPSLVFGAIERQFKQ